MPAVEFIRRLETLGVREVIFTDIATDGMLRGPNLDSLSAVADSAPGSKVIASGGIAGVEDLLAVAGLRRQNIVGAITGKALYTGALDLASAIAGLRGIQGP